MKNKASGLFITAAGFFALSVLLLTLGKYAVVYNGVSTSTKHETYEIEFSVFALLFVSISLAFASFVVYLHSKGQHSDQVRLGLNDENRD